jgi:hypothetical protein
MTNASKRTSLICILALATIFIVVLSTRDDAAPSVGFTPVLPAAADEPTLAFAFTTSVVTYWDEKACLVESKSSDGQMKTNRVLWDSTFKKIGPAGAGSMISAIGTAYWYPVTVNARLEIPRDCGKFRVRETYIQASWLANKSVAISIGHPFISRVLWYAHPFSKRPPDQVVYSPWIYRTNNTWVIEQ